jgi:hypothetical protein
MQKKNQSIASLFMQKMLWGSALLAATLLLAGCNPQYLIKNGQVYIKEWNEADGTGERLVAGADASTFQPFKTDANVLVGRDQYHVFLDGGVLGQADPKTMTYLGNYFFADKQTVYFVGFQNDSSGYEVMGANPRTTRTAKEYPWAYDDQHAIYGPDLLKVPDSNTLVGLSDSWAKTASKVLYKRKILDGADATTFRVVDDYTGQDKYRRYHPGD